MSDAPLASVEEVRENLRRLGYLESGLDRFVLPEGPGTPFSAALRAAARLAAVGGPLLGVGLALVASGFDPRLLERPSDLVLLSIYLSIASALALALLVLLAGTLTATVGRRLGRAPGPWLPRAVGLLHAGAGLAYLALWWPSRAAVASLAVQAGVLALGLFACAALFRFGSLAAVAVLSAGGLQVEQPRASLGGRHVLALVAAAVVLLVGGISAGARLTARPSAAAELAVVPSGLRVRLLAIDGLDGRMLALLRERGELPRLDALLDRSAHARLQVEPEPVPALVFTTVATGRGPEAHGIRATGTRRLAGMSTDLAIPEPGRLGRALVAAADLLRLTREQPVTALLRDEKTVWNVASDAGLRVGIVNWWASWPAEPLRGFVVSDRALFRLEKGGAPDREAQPQDVLSRLRPLLPAAEPDRARRIDRFHFAAARALRGTEPPDLEALYLPGLDITTVQELGDEAGADLAALETRIDTVRAHYRLIDELVGQAADELGPNDVLLLLGDPGRLARRGGRPPEGVLALLGPVVRPGALTSATERDVAPTLLHLLGLPVSRELPGRVLQEGLDPGFLRAHPVRSVASFGRRGARPAQASVFDHQVLEELRSLGYVN